MSQVLIEQQVLGTLEIDGDPPASVQVEQISATILEVAQQGPAGPTGSTGAPGAPGSPGPPGTDATYVHDQGAPSAVWTINHNLGKRPAVFAENSAGDDVIGEIDHPSANQTVLTFSAATGGKAFLN